jgi:exportin-2 (importin alpha re-exporter)
MGCNALQCIASCRAVVHSEVIYHVALNCNAYPALLYMYMYTYIFTNTLLSSNNCSYHSTWFAAEQNLVALQKTPGFSISLLELVASAHAQPAIRQGAAVNFKNTIKKGWDVENESGIMLQESDRHTIKSHLVQLMSSTPPEIQSQLSEAIALIATHDYPEKWTNLRDELVRECGSADMNIVIGALKTANSIFKSFRHVGRSDELYKVILYTLEGFQAPLLALAKSLGQAVDSLASDAASLKARMIALRLVCRIFYSLNYQDLPEFFEDHMKEWMSEFAKYLQYQNPVLVDPSEDEQPSCIDDLQVAIINNLNLYANKDEEPFMEFLPQFTTLVWNLLMQTTDMPKHDTLATTSIRFLSSLIQKQMHRKLFENEETLRQIIVKIVIPNIMFRESDEERFEDDPREYILTEVEGSDNESRRRCAQDLLRAMCRQFSAETCLICMEHVNNLLQEYTKSPNQNWAAKDAAVSYRCFVQYCCIVLYTCSLYFCQDFATWRASSVLGLSIFGLYRDDGCVCCCCCCCCFPACNVFLMRY